MPPQQYLMASKINQSYRSIYALRRLRCPWLSRTTKHFIAGVHAALRFAMVSCLYMLISVAMTLTLPALAQMQPSAHDLNLAGVKLQSQGKLVQAADQYRQAIKLQPAAAGYHNNLALVLKDLDQLPTAEQEARTAVKLKPKRGDYHYNLAIILQKENKLNEAETEYKFAAELDPMDTECHYRLAQVMSQLNRTEEAEDQLKLALIDHRQRDVW